MPTPSSEIISVLSVFAVVFTVPIFAKSLTLTGLWPFWFSGSIQNARMCRGRIVRVFLKRSFYRQLRRA